ncbi:MAG: cell wall-binding repeat-containing protein [Candidatus Andersenbacteria bacterium]
MFFFSLQRVVAPKELARWLPRRKRRTSLSRFNTVRNSTFRAITKSLLALGLVAAVALPTASQAMVQPAQYWLNGGVIRLMGADRYETAVRVSEFEFGGQGFADKIVIASGENFPDALVAAPLAAKLHAPLLLTRRDALPEITRRNLKWVFNGKKDTEPDVFVIGGENVISQSVIDAIKAQNANINVTRIQGKNRSETSTNVANQMGWPAVQRVAIVNGTKFADAVIASAPASDKAVDPNLIPILLNISAQSLDPIIKSALEDGFKNGLTTIDIFGGAQVLNPLLEQEIRDLATSHGVAATINRFGGLTRYDTSAEVAEAFFRNGVTKSFGIASGESFADALVGGRDTGEASQSNQGQVLLLVKKDQIPSAVTNFLETFKDRLNSGVVYGGYAAVSESVKETAEDYID